LAQATGAEDNLNTATKNKGPKSHGRGKFNKSAVCAPAIAAQAPINLFKKRDATIKKFVAFLFGFLLVRA
jgi:hypothetical protein